MVSSFLLMSFISLPKATSLLSSSRSSTGMNKKIQLKKDYYLDNFIKLLSFLESRYGFLLNCQEKAFIEEFKQFSHSAQCLFVRLSSRKGPLFREDKLEYSEINPIEEATQVLSNANWLIQIQDLSDLKKFTYRSCPCAEIGAEEVLKLFTVPELKELQGGMRAAGPGTRAEIVARCLPDDSLLNKILKNYCVWFPMHQQLVKRFLFMFFGNCQQTLSDFILEEIGNLKYEPYLLDDKSLYFSTREIIDSTFYFLTVREYFYQLVEEKELLPASKLLGELEPLVLASKDKKLLKKWKKLHYHLGHAFERVAEFSTALDYYSVYPYPPARERKIRVLEKMGNSKEAQSLLTEMELLPLDSSEIDFWGRRRKKVETYKTEKFELGKQYALMGVESALLNYFTEQGYQGFFLENMLWNALLGLYFWDIIFSPLKGAFFNPFQRGPVDIFSGAEFYMNRRQAIDIRLAEIKNGDLRVEEILDLYRKKYKTANYFVGWKYIEPTHLKIVLNYVSSVDLANIFERMVYDLRQQTSGLPDLFVGDYRSSGTSKDYLLVEVKGPGDTLRPNQKSWLRYFEEKEIPYLVAKVVWKDD